MPLMDISDIREARKQRWFHGLSGGIGFQTWQVITGLIVAVVVGLVFLLIGMQTVGVVAALGLGYAAAITPNLVNTHHQDARDYFEGQIKKRIQHTLAINDNRVPEPSDWHERYVVEITEFPSDNGDSNAH